jgi:hypothetical protein
MEPGDAQSAKLTEVLHESQRGDHKSVHWVSPDTPVSESMKNCRGFTIFLDAVSMK